MLDGISAVVADVTHPPLSALLVVQERWLSAAIEKFGASLMVRDEEVASSWSLLRDWFGELLLLCATERGLKVGILIHVFCIFLYPQLNAPCESS